MYSGSCQHWRNGNASKKKIRAVGGDGFKINNKGIRKHAFGKNALAGNQTE